jgi:hypothetical protein
MLRTRNDARVKQAGSGRADRYAFAKQVLRNMDRIGSVRLTPGPIRFARDSLHASIMVAESREGQRQNGAPKISD